MKKLLLVLFVLAVVSDLSCILLGFDECRFVSKPLLMILLLAYYVFAAKPMNRMIVIALLLSLAGDVLLMWDDYFIPGLISFLTAHVFYIFAFRQLIDLESETGLIGVQRVRFAFPIVLSGTGLVVILYPVLNDLKIPVMIYALVIVVMALNALFRFGRTTQASFALTFGGAVLFMISDSLLAVNKFLSPLDMGGFWIMLTYCAAQFLIVTGLMRHPVKEREA